ncbi:hypothetical protein ABIB37_001796 [Agrococcus sp. UYP10]|uniref:hypothetical protein n=1 Tax=Agrococcus sp. UYP10 TaxID=1756355 RepID=UPI0033942E20
MGQARAQAIAMASVELFGTLLNAAVSAGFVNVVMASIRTDYQPNLKQVRSRVSALINNKFNALSGHDRSALVDAAETALRSLKIDDDLVRATNSASLFLELVLTRVREALGPVMEDAATRDSIESIVRIVCDWIAAEIRRAPKHFGLRLDQAVDDIDLQRGALARLTANHEAVEHELKSHAARLAGAEDAVAMLDPFLMLSFVSPTSLFVAAVDHRALPACFVGRSDDLSELSRAVSACGMALVAGPELSGRFELARQWSMRERSLNTTYAVTYSSSDQLSTAVRALAQSRGVNPYGDIASVVGRLLRAQPELTLIVCDLDRSDLIERLAAACEPDAGVLLLTTGRAVGDEYDAALHLPALEEESILELLAAELPDFDVSVLDPLAKILRGLPETARVAAALVRRAGSAGDASLRAILADPALVLGVPLERSVSNRTQNAVWARVLDEFRQSAAFDGRLLLASLHVMQGRVLDVQLMGVAGLLTAATFEAVPDAFGDTFAHAKQSLQSLDLIDVASGMVSASRLLTAYCWRELNPQEQRRVVRACLGSAKTAASLGRYSREIVYYYCAAWLQTSETDEYRDIDRASFDDAVVQLANLMNELDLRESAVGLLGRLFALQGDDGSGAAWSTGVRIGHMLFAVDTVTRSREYVNSLERQYADVEVDLDPEEQCSYWSLVAKSRWEAGDLVGVRSAAASGLALLDQLEDASTSLPASALLRVGAWAEISLGDVPVGLDMLERGFAILAALGGAPSLEEYVSQTQTFLFEREVNDWLNWRDRPIAVKYERPAISDVIGVNSKWISVAAARSVGDLPAAEKLLADGLPEIFDSNEELIYGISPFYQAVWHAERLVHRAGIAIESESTPPRLALLLLKSELSEGVARLERLPAQEREMKRALGWRNALWIQMAGLCRLVGDPRGAVTFARGALESDAVLYGEDHAEYANDAIMLALSLIETAAERHDPSVGEAKKLIEVAARIFSTPGPQQHATHARTAAGMLQKLELD